MLQSQRIRSVSTTKKHSRSSAFDSSYFDMGIFRDPTELFKTLDGNNAMRFYDGASKKDIGNICCYYSKYNHCMTSILRFRNLCFSDSHNVFLFSGALMILKKEGNVTIFVRHVKLNCNLITNSFVKMPLLHLLTPSAPRRDYIITVTQWFSFIFFRNSGHLR